MNKPNVYFLPASTSSQKHYAQEALTVFKAMIKGENITLPKEVPLKIHPGEPGNTSFNKPENYSEIINYLQNEKINTYYIETNTVTGRRTNKTDHLKAVAQHGFTQIPFVIADGEKGTDDVAVPIEGGTYFKAAKIARLLADKTQVLVLSHFKGHVTAGFGAAIKMLALGFASRRGKMELHTIETPTDDGTINWADGRNLQPNDIFRKRMVEYAAAASIGRHHLYLTYAINLVTDCDCDGHPMKPIYSDLGIFASTDPLAIDVACFDELAKREGKTPFEGNEVFSYAQRLGVGSLAYNLVRVK